MKWLSIKITHDINIIVWTREKSVIIVRVSKKRVSESKGSLHIDSNHFSFLRFTWKAKLTFLIGISLKKVAEMILML